MTSPLSGSEPTSSSSFTQLHPALQRWVYDEKWVTLHDAQERAIAPILAGDRDVVISAATAAGKTEAAFLPILSTLALDRDERSGAAAPDPWLQYDPWNPPAPVAASGVEVLCVSPLKALINDQFGRLEQMAERADVQVHRWHGDVAGSAKAKLRRNPSGVLIITPESLEAMFVNRGSQIATMFAGLRYVVIDELHSFLSSARGAQLQSLLNRVELVLRRQVPRIGLSATLGDLGAAATFLRPTNPDEVVIIAAPSDGQELQLQLRGYRQVAPAITKKTAAKLEAAGETIVVEDITDGDKLEIAEHIYRTLRGSDNLVFANARSSVEIYADLLRRRSEADRVADEFFPHHGSLSKDAREDVELMLNDRTRPATAVCTSTLEMGIDIGTVTSVAQVGPPPSVASLRQRLGRSGRRDEPAVMRMYVTEPELDPRSSPVDQLRCNLVQSVAMVRLLLGHWLEPPDAGGLNLSTLIQQVLSTIAQVGGAKPDELYRGLCGPGPFGAVDQKMFVRLLRVMKDTDLIIQSSDGLVLHGEVGERIVNHYSFYAAFDTPEEWQLFASGRPLGSMPIVNPLVIGGFLIFSGRRWQITAVDVEQHIVELTRSAAGVPPTFTSSDSLVHDRVREEMVAVYRDTDVPGWLSSGARRLLEEARDSWVRFRLDDRVLFESGKTTVVLPWVGDRALVTAALALRGMGLEASTAGPELDVESSSNHLINTSQKILDGPPLDAVALATWMENTRSDKWDWVLDDTLAAESAAARVLDVAGATRVLSAIAATNV